MKTQRQLSIRTSLVLGISASFALLASAIACSSSSSPNDGTGGTTSDSSGGSTNTASGGSTNTASGGSTSVGVGGASSSGGATNAAGCTSVPVEASTGIWPVINVELVAAKDGNTPYTQVMGFPWDGPQTPELLTETATVSSCQLLKVIGADCSPTACNATAVTCVGNNQWARKPQKVASGTLSFTGLTLQSGGTSVTLSPIANQYQAAGSTAVAYPPCMAGADVTVSGGAGTANSYTLTAKCIDPVVVTNSIPLAFEGGKSTTFTWTPASGGNTRIEIEIDISHHGGLKGLIRCDVPDTGSATVDGSLAAQLIGWGTAGFPEASMTRHSIDTTNVGSGTATLDVKSTTTIALQVPGVTSCSDTLPCPSGQTCTSAKCQ